MRAKSVILSSLIAVLATSSVVSAESLTVAHNGGTVVAAQHEAFFVPFAKNTGNSVVEDSQYFAVMKGSPRQELSTDMIHFSSSPEPQAEHSRRIDYAPANAKAFALLSPEEPAALPQGHLDKASLQSGKVYIDLWMNKGDALL